MLSLFRVYHLNTSHHESLELPKGFHHFGTCLRSIVFTELEVTPDVLEHYEVFHGKEAYSFILQVICGLQSQLFGETEISGQFRSFVKAMDDYASHDLKKIFVALNADAKKIRTDFLQTLEVTPMEA